VTRHHPYLGDPVLDPDYEGARAHGLYGEGKNAASLRRFFAGLLLPTTTFRYIQYLLKHRIVSRHERKPETLVRILYLSGLVATFVALGWGKWLALYWWCRCSHGELGRQRHRAHRALSSDGDRDAEGTSSSRATACARPG